MTISVVLIAQIADDDNDADSDEPADGELTPAQIMKYIARRRPRVA